jgi:hypothetical protein
MGGIVVGDHIGAFTVLSVDPTGKRVAVSCPCGAVHLFGADALRSGAAVCTAVPLTIAQRKAIALEMAARTHEREWRRWKPGQSG